MPFNQYNLKYPKGTVGPAMLNFYRRYHRLCSDVEVSQASPEDMTRIQALRDKRQIKKIK